MSIKHHFEDLFFFFSVTAKYMSPCAPGATAGIVSHTFCDVCQPRHQDRTRCKCGWVMCGTRLFGGENTDENLVIPTLIVLPWYQKVIFIGGYYLFTFAAALWLSVPWWCFNAARGTMKLTFWCQSIYTKLCRKQFRRKLFSWENVLLVCLCRKKAVLRRNLLIKKLLKTSKRNECWN